MDTAPLTDADLRAIRERWEAATPGEWIVADGEADGFPGEFDVVGSDHCGIASMSGTAQAAKMPRDKAANAAFIAASKTDVERLLGEVERLQEVINIAGGKLTCSVAYYPHYKDGFDAELIKDCEACGNKLCDQGEAIESTRNEVASVLMLMDGLAEQWGDEGVFRRCRDRLRAIVTTGGDVT